MTLFMDQPFLYHNKLIEILVVLMKSKIRDTVKSRVRKYFSFPYLIKLLS